MRVSVYLPLLLSAVLAVGTPVLSRRLAPTVAARVLTLSAAVTAAASTWGLLLLATTLLQHTPEAEEHGTQARPVPVLAAAVAVVALTLAVSRAWHAVRVRLQTDHLPPPVMPRCRSGTCWQAPPGFRAAQHNTSAGPLSRRSLRRTAPPAT